VVITNVLLIQRVNKFENRSIFDEVKAYEVEAYKKCAVFWATLYNRRRRLQCSVLGQAQFNC